MLSVPLHLGPKSQQTVDLFRNELANYPEILSVSSTYTEILAKEKITQVLVRL